MLCVSLQFYIFNNKLTPVEDYWYIQNVSIQSSSNNGGPYNLSTIKKKKSTNWIQKTANKHDPLFSQKE